MKQTLSEDLAKKIPDPVLNIFNIFQSAGYEIYLVGGGVRNLFLNKPIANCDFTTNAHPEVIQTLIPDSFYDNVFGTVGTMIKTQEEESASVPTQSGLRRGEEKYEITTYRCEKGYTDFRRPDNLCWGVSLEEDLKRRDFTINAMVVGIARKQETVNSEQSLELVDLFDGLKDLENKIIRAVGNPDERFSEDALRMMRAIRFSAQLGFTIEPETFKAIQNNAGLINKISKERIKEELFRTLESDHPSEGITFFYNSGLLAYILPELIKGYGMNQAKHHIYDVWNHSLMSLKNCPSKDPLVRLATLLHDVGKPATVKGEGEKRTFYNHEVAGERIVKEIAQRLKFSKKEEEKLVTLVRWHQFTVDERQTDSAIRRFITNVGKENLNDILDLRVGDRLGGGARETSWRLEKFKKRLEEVQIQPFSVTDLKINGRDVMEILNIPPGPKVGQVLADIFKEVEEQKLENDREKLLEKIKSFGADSILRPD